MFTEFMNAKVTLIKKNESTQVPNIPAMVDKKSIYIEGSSVLIEPGDYLERLMSNGAKELYEVIDPGFQEPSLGFDAHYQMEVKKLGLPEANRIVQRVTYNMSGNARVNNSSVDNSANLIVSNEFADLIGDLKKEIIEAKLSPIERASSLEIAGELELQTKKNNPSKAVVKTLAEGLPKVANIISIVNFIIERLK